MSDYNIRILNRMAEAFLQDRMDFITPCCSYPLPVFLEGDLQVFGSADTFAEALRLYRDAALSIGTVTLRPRIVAEGVPVRGYSSVWVEWDHLDETGRCLRSNQVRYATYRSTSALHPRIEMVDYTVTAFPGALDEMPQRDIA